MKIARTWAAITACYAAVVVAMLAPFSNYAAFGSAISPGDPKLLAWTFAWVNHAILARLPLFDANIFYPARPSLAYAEHHLGVAIWGLPLWAATHNAVLVYSTLRVLALLLNAVAMHVLVWRWTGSHKAALLAGLTFGVSAPRTFYSAHVPLVWNCWLPLLVLSARQWMDTRRPKWALFSTVLFCLQALVSWYLAVMAAMALAVFASWRLLSNLVPHHEPATGDTAGNGARSHFRRWLSPALQVIAGVAVTIAVLWPLARPYLALRDEVHTVTPALCASVKGYLAPSHYSLVAPLFVWATGQNPLSAEGEHSQFLGWMALALAALGVLRVATLLVRGTRADGERRDLVFGGYFVLLGLLGFALSLGPAGPRDWWRPFDAIAAVPVLNLFRVPARFAVLVVFALAGLVGLGCRWAAGGVGQVAARGLCAGLAVVMLLEWVTLVPARERPMPDPVPPIYALLRTLPVHAVVSLPCYRSGETAPLDADYMLYSTRHWRPIVNGYGRAAPADMPWVLGTISAFAGPNSAKRMRALGIDYVVVHTARYPDKAADMVQQALTGDDFELVARVQGDYLFHVRPRSR